MEKRSLRSEAGSLPMLKDWEDADDSENDTKKDQVGRKQENQKRIVLRFSGRNKRSVVQKTAKKFCPMSTEN